MPAFEELGIGPELLQVLSEQEWYLPTDVQDEAIPLILGGGDVLAAAETGSGKSGAFILPILQVLYEKLGKTTMVSEKELKIQLSQSDRDMLLVIDETGLKCQTNDTKQWFGCRANTAVGSGGRYYYECMIQSTIGVSRVGWAMSCANFNLGMDDYGFGYGGTGKKSNQRNFLEYGESYTEGDVIGCLLDLDNGTMSFSKNGEMLGVAFTIDKASTYFPAVAMRNSQIAVCFHPDELIYRPKEYGTLYDVRSTVREEKKGPMAIIIEPTRDLAEQVNGWIDVMKKYMTLPSIRNAVCVGGTNFNANKKEIRKGCDILVATTGRFMELIQKQVVSLRHVQFLILDEADRLIETEQTKSIMAIYDQIQPFRENQDRLQVCFFSATLHSAEIEQLRDRMCFHPVYVDLKGKDSVPDTVHHVVIPIGPADTAQYKSMPDPPTDQVCEKQDSESLALKLIKPKILVKLIEKLKMDQCMIFCRTNLDCDQLQKYFTSLGNTSYHSALEYSCCVIAGMRSMEERRKALATFQNGSVRFLICTDVAARGIDIRNLPFMINLTLPDTIENYIHRIGRVGRQDCLGLAISLVSTVRERVWYHTCNKPKSCKNRKLVEKGGCTIWYDEQTLLKQIEERLGQTIDTISSTTLALPAQMKDLTRYGMHIREEVRDSNPNLEALQPAIVQLANIETQVQKSWFETLNQFNKT